MEQTVPGVCSPAAAAACSTALGKTAWPRYPAQNSIAKKRSWRPRPFQVEMLSSASGSGTRLPGGRDGAPYRLVLQTRFYLVTLNHSAQTHSSTWLLSTCTAAEAKTLRPSTSFASKRAGTLALCRDGVGAALLMQPVLPFHVELWLRLPSSLSLPLPASTGKWASPGIFITIPIAAKRLRQRPGGGCALLYEAQGR